MDSSRIKKFFRAFLNSYAGIFFISDPVFGAVLFLVSIINFNMGFAGFLCVLSAYLFARLLGLKETFLGLDFYIYNPLLVGLAIGYLFKLGPLTLIFLVSLGILTFLITYSLSSIFSYYFKLPVLSIPFVIGSFIVYLASLRYSNLFVTSLYPHYPSWDFSLPVFFKGFFDSIGTILFSPYTLAGVIIFLALFLYSRILAFLAIIGYFGATLVTALMTGSFEKAFSDISAFNYILIAMAVGGVFLIPSPKSYFMALVASLIAVPVVESTKTFWQHFGIPVFALPFNTVTLLMVYTLGLVGYETLTKFYRGTPEKTLDYFLTVIKRFPFWGREISLPFTGEWTVWQSFHGKWTHKGVWQYAVDFVITDEEGKTFSGDGSLLSDYYAFQKPVLSPVRGRVVKVVSNLPDNPPGKADKENNLGNFIQILDERGFYVVIGHLSKDSIKVKPGDWVEKGKFLGLCGNSGYSPQPHIHIHVQLLPEIGAPTVPFSFAPFIKKGNVFVDNGVPEDNDRVRPVYPDKSLHDRLNMLIDMVFRFEVFENGKKTGIFQAVVKMAPDGTFYMTDGKAKLYFGISHGTFYCYNFEGSDSSYLKYIFLASPKVPLYFEKGLVWKDYLPIELVGKRFTKAFFRFLASFNHNFYEIKGTYRVIDTSSFAGKVKFMNLEILTETILHERIGFDSVRVDMKGNRIVLRRIRDEKIFISNFDIDGNNYSIDR
ncbi:urea transporter [Desulfurobacterium indicum]|uniref:Peptidase M23 n=1 Tax=Desulfurobacterium indicum TaxID=1914305 RepID=A0A1R1MJC7_9BACT|nr:urea transporter [Desulfurobacterium indicum]OMH39907.1 peptidase M23 [Desulfurobacterium indicum]